MAKPRFHTVAAFVVLAVSAAWVLTGEFSSIGSAAPEQSGEAQQAEKPADAAPQKVVRTVGVGRGQTGGLGRKGRMAPRADEANVVLLG